MPLVYLTSLILVLGGETPAAANPADSNVAVTSAFGSDWPDFLGPRRDSKSPEAGILTAWPPAGPPIVWTRALGAGYGIGTVSRGRYFQLDRINALARLVCLESKTGRELWTFTYESNYEDMFGYNNGPRCSPVVDGDRVYIYGAEGMLHCLNVEDGSVVWQVDTKAEYHVVQNFFGVGSTPLIEGDLLIAQVGGSPPGNPLIYEGRIEANGSGIVAFNKWTGQEVYRTADELASYAAPVAATIAGERWCFSFCRGGLVGIDPQQGTLRAYWPWRAALLESVNASTPVVFQNRVFISEAYGPGSALLEVKEGELRTVWSDASKPRNKTMQLHWNTPVYHEGYLYGSSGRHRGEAELRCVHAESGKIAWSQPGLTRASLLYVDGHLVCLGEDGSLRLIRATAERYQPVAQATLTQDGEPLLRYPAWAAPILAHGLLYVRGDSQLVCLELIPQRDRSAGGPEPPPVTPPQYSPETPTPRRPVSNP